MDIQVVWELQNLGLREPRRGPRARGRAAGRRCFELLRTQDRVAAEVVQAHAQVAAVGEPR